ncbi:MULTISPECIES: NAD(P)-dependent oxidoreductase [unclassified Amycolatopsis]|uniref:NAD-dependent epimerase/dehydratase family protein n=1 Tax=unclassified Amycolatopsis TaxID=2618356 RepID=UPI001C6A7493|nr:NAD(P)-dependent oxidoreductase [Amycolatopsis sp. DSM 110486]QYN18720.1 NAD(P)-dependent oxidoreductase [Amycolatopsis sp. DSM 110486]
MAGTIVTGSAGFLGAHLVRAVADRGGRVVAADLAEPPADVLALWAGRPVEYRKLDVRDPGAVFAEVRPEVVIHAAAVTNGDRATLRQVNVDGTAAVLAAAGPARVVYVSSASVYADSAGVLDEASPVRTDPGDYPASKLAAEQLAAEAGAVIARVAACYGPLERDTGTRQVMSLPYTAVRAALGGRLVRVAAEAAGQSFDPTWVADIAEGVAALAGAEGPPHRLYNIGSGTAVTLAELADTVNSVVGAPHAGGDPLLLRLPPGHRTGALDVTRLRELSVREPTPLAVGLTTYLGWLREHHY